MITQSTRQSLLCLFSFSFVFVGIFIFKMSMFEIFLIVVLAGIVVKLTDIQDEIQELRWRK